MSPDSDPPAVSPTSGFREVVAKGAGPRPATTCKVLVIGSGFGGTMVGLSLAHRFAKAGRSDRITILERGTWWTTPVGTVQDKEVRTYDFLRAKGQPVQFWSSAEHFRGFVDIVLRCLRRPGNLDGLYEVTQFGRRAMV
jgi:choline dehydrogenase-like flavoprotein